MVSSYGLLLYWRRLAGWGHRVAIEEIASAERLDEASIRELQDRLLTQTVRHAAQTVPYYKELFARSGIEPRHINSLDRIAMLPLLEKAEVRRNPQAFWSSEGGKGYTVSTSGTTGSPLSIRCSRRSLLKNYAHFYRLRQRLGVGDRDRCATFAGRTIVEPGRTSPPFWRHNWATNSILYSTYHLAPANLDAYLEQLNEQAPVLIDAYPSALGIIANGLRARPDLQVRPKAIVASSETLLPHQRDAAEAAFGCPVTDHYCTAEMNAFVAQCELGTHHVWPTAGICEILVDGRAAEPGERGELVTTGFINDMMPLIRYRTGDTAVRGDGCGCGLSFPTIASIEGRMDDVLVSPDGRQVGRLDPIFKGLADDAFHEVQIAQVAADRVVLRYVPGTRFDPSAVEQVTRELGVRMGPAVRVESEQAAYLARGANGKLPAVVGLGRTSTT
jgi:phenylacetate-CoA ligase